MNADITTSPYSRFALRASEHLRKWELRIETLAPWAALAVLFVFSRWAWLASRGLRFEFDELLELCATTAPSYGDVLSFLASGVDYNPPLSHFLIRESLALLGTSEFSARLPAFLGMTVFLICLYRVVSRMLSPAYGLLAMVLMVCLPVRIYALQARPYGQVLGFTALSLLFYQQAVSGRRRLIALAGLAFCTACLAASHYYAVLVLSAFFLAECVRAIVSRRFDWALWASTLVPPVLVLFMLRGIIRQQKQQLTHYFATGNLLSFNHGYEFLDMDPLIYCVALVLLVATAGVIFAFQEWPAKAPFTARPHEIALGVGLLLLPITGAFCTQFVTHAYVPRYFLPAALGFGICFCCAARLFASVLPGLPLLLLIPLAIGFGEEFARAASHGSGTLPPRSELSVATAPILFDTPFEYMQVNYYFPELREKTWVITDPAASLKYRKYDTDDNIMLAIASHGRAQVVGLAAAVRRWPHFSLVPRAGDSVWALKCLLESGADVRVKHALGDTNFIFDVLVPPESLPAIDSCSSASTK